MEELLTTTARVYHRFASGEHDEDGSELVA